MTHPVFDLSSVFDFIDESSDAQPAPQAASDPYIGELVASPLNVDDDVDIGSAVAHVTPQRPSSLAEQPEPPGAPRRVRRNIRPAAALSAANREHECELHATHDVASRKASAQWAAKQRRMNVLTHTATVPCDMLSLTRQRIQFEALAVGVKKTQSQLAQLVDKERAVHADSVLNSSTDPHVPRVLDVNDETHNNRLAGHDSLDKYMALMGESKTWQALRADATSGKLQQHMTNVRKAVLQFREASESIAYVFERARVLRAAEQDLVQLMYPQTVEDVHKLLAAYDVVRADTQPSIVLPTLGGDVCQICQEAEIGQHFLRIVPRCSTHAGCIEERRGKRACQCVGKLFHVNCLATDILYHYRGDTNEGVGRSQLRCPTCRNVYCVTDLVAVRVLEASPQKKRAVTASQEEATPSKRTRTYSKRDAPPSQEQEQEQQVQK